MSRLLVVSRDPWMRGWAVSGGLMLGWASIAELPWLLWLAWAYLGLVSLLDVPRDATHTLGGRRVWQTQRDE